MKRSKPWKRHKLQERIKVAVLTFCGSVGQLEGAQGMAEEGGMEVSH